MLLVKGRPMSATRPAESIAKPNRRLRFGTRALFAATFVAALLAWGLRSLMSGPVELIAAPVSTGSSGVACFVACQRRQVLRVAAEFDRPRLAALARDRLAKTNPNALPAIEDVAVYLLTGNDFVGLKYDCLSWGRRRFDPLSLQTVCDSNDPDAASRNAAIQEAFQHAGKQLAAEAKGKLQLAKTP